MGGRPASPLAASGRRARSLLRGAVLLPSDLQGAAPARRALQAAAHPLVLRPHPLAIHAGTRLLCRNADQPRRRAGRPAPRPHARTRCEASPVPLLRAGVSTSDHKPVFATFEVAASARLHGAAGPRVAARGGERFTVTGDSFRRRRLEPRAARGAARGALRCLPLCPLCDPSAVTATLGDRNHVRPARLPLPARHHPRRPERPQRPVRPTPPPHTLAAVLDASWTCGSQVHRLLHQPARPARRAGPDLLGQEGCPRDGRTRGGRGRSARGARAQLLDSLH